MQREIIKFDRYFGDKSIQENIDALTDFLTENLNLVRFEDFDYNEGTYIARMIGHAENNYPEIMVCCMESGSYFQLRLYSSFTARKCRDESAFTGSSSGIDLGGRFTIIGSISGTSYVNYRFYLYKYSYDNGLIAFDCDWTSNTPADYPTNLIYSEYILECDGVKRKYYGAMYSSSNTNDYPIRVTFPTLDDFNYVYNSTKYDCVLETYTDSSVLTLGGESSFKIKIYNNFYIYHNNNIKIISPVYVRHPNTKYYPKDILPIPSEKKYYSIYNSTGGDKYHRGGLWMPDFTE